MSEQRRSSGRGAAVAAGLIIGAVECVLAIAFATLVFGSRLPSRLPDAIGLYLAAAALILGILAWRAGGRGIVGSVQDAPAAVLAGVATVTAAKVTAIQQVAQATHLTDYEAPDVFLTVVAATLVVTVVCGIVFFALGRFRLGNLVRFVPYPVVGGFLAGTGWLLFKGGIQAASGIIPTLRSAEQFIREYALLRWVPAFLFGVILLVAVRRVKRPIVIPIVIAAALVAFVIGMLVTGSSIDDARDGNWLLGPFETTRLWQPWSLRSIGGADWPSVLSQWKDMLIAVLVASLAILFNITGSEIVLRRDLDTNRELRDAGALNVVSGAVGGVPGYHALSLTALADRMNASARVAGLVAAIVPLAAVIFGASVIELIPRMLVGGVLMFLGLAFMVEWVWDMRKVLPRLEYAITLVILGTIATVGFLRGIVVGLVFAVVLFVLRYGRGELVREGAFAETYRSNVDRPIGDVEALRAMRDRVLLLRIDGFVFFGSTNSLLERVRRRIEAEPPRFLVMDLTRVSGVDSSAAMAFAKIARQAEADGFELVLAGASDGVRDRLARAGVVASDGTVRFEPDLDHALQRCEEALLAESPADAAPGSADDDLAAMPRGLLPHLERESLPEGAVVIRQADAPDDVFVLGSGRLSIETETAAGSRMRLRTIRPGVVVGEIALYTGARTADVVAETPVEVLRLRAATLARIEAEDPALAAEVHAWLARTMAVRLGDSLKTVDALVD